MFVVFKKVEWAKEEEEKKQNGRHNALKIYNWNAVRAKDK